MPSNKTFLLCTLLYFFFNFIYLFLERGEGRETERERNINVWLPLMWPPTGDLACNPGMCPDWESNQRPFGSQPVLNPLSYTSLIFITLHLTDVETDVLERSGYHNCVSSMTTL